MTKTYTNQTNITPRGLDPTPYTASGLFDGLTVWNSLPDELG